MVDFLRNNKLILGGALIVIVAVMWYILAGNSNEPILQAEPATEFSTDRELVTTLLELREITLSGVIFADPVFQGLKDIGTEIVQEPVGRPNPFAPLIGGSRATTTRR